MRSSDAAFGVAILLVSVVALLIVLGGLLVFCRKASPETGRQVTLAVLVIGAGIALTGLVSALLRPPPVQLPPDLLAAFLAVGSAVCMQAVLHLEKVDDKLRGVRRAWVVLLVSGLLLGSFWASTLHAQKLGRELAESVDQKPDGLPLVTVFTSGYVDLAGSYVRAKEFVRGDTSYWRYTGLRLLAHSDQRWFLLSGRYGSTYRPSVVIVDGDADMRIEVAVPARADTE